MKEALRSSEMSTITSATQRDILGDAILHSRRRENLKSYIGCPYFVFLAVSLRFNFRLFLSLTNKESRRKDIPTSGGMLVSGQFHLLAPLPSPNFGP
jgi:hypothetical protein